MQGAMQKWALMRFTSYLVNPTPSLQSLVLGKAPAGRGAQETQPGHGLCPELFTFQIFGVIRVEYSALFDLGIFNHLRSLLKPFGSL